MAEHDILLEGVILEGTQDRARQEVLIDLIREGFGNRRDAHYYKADLLQREAAKFAGAKQYINHIDPETERRLGGLPRPIEHLGGRILETTYLAPGETHMVPDPDDSTRMVEGWAGTNGGDRSVIRGRSKIAQPWLWSMIENDPELLGVSIHAGGRSNPGTMEGRQAKIVEAISHVRSVDWVTEAGAGGKVFALVEAQLTAEEETLSDTTLDIEAQVSTLKTKGMSESQARRFVTVIARRAEAGNPVTEAEIDTAVELALEAPAEDTPAHTSMDEADPIRPKRDTSNATKGGATDELDKQGNVQGLRTSADNPSSAAKRVTGDGTGSGASIGSGGGTPQPGPKVGGFTPGGQQDELDRQGHVGGGVGSMGEFTHQSAGPGTTFGSNDRQIESAVLAVLDVLDPTEALEGALAGSELEGDVDDELEAAWRTFSGFVQSDLDRARKLVEEYSGDDDDTEDDMDQDLEARAVEIAEQRLEEAVRAATETLREQYESKLRESEAEYNRRLQEAQARFERALTQKDQRILAAQLIERAGFRPRTEAALKEDFHDAYFEAETDEQGTVVHSGDDRLRVAVEEAIKAKRAELGDYVEARVTGAGETDSSLREAGVRSGERPKRAPLDQEIDRQIGIGDEADAGQSKAPASA
jgi:hypothetical protein